MTTTSPPNSPPTSPTDSPTDGPRGPNENVETPFEPGNEGGVKELNVTTAHGTEATLRPLFVDEANDAVVVTSIQEAHVLFFSSSRNNRNVYTRAVPSGGKVFIFAKSQLAAHKCYSQMFGTEYLKLLAKDLNTMLSEHLLKSL